MHAYTIIEISGGAPNVNFLNTPINGYVLAAGPFGNYGLYLVSGTGAQLTALNALSNVWGLVAMDDSGDVRWSQLDNVIAAGVRTKLNQFASARGWPNVPAGWTYRQVLTWLVNKFKRDNDDWDLNKTWVSDTP